jgi:type I restriction enzyme, S subunit
MWETVKLGDIATVIAGQSPKGEHYNKDGKGTPFYQGKKDYGERYLQDPTVWTDVVTKLAEKDDILMSVRAPVGALNIATQQICIGRGLAAIRPTEEVLHDYLFYSLLLISQQIEGSTGAIFNSINKKQIEEIDLLLPSLSEQKSIVAKLDAAFAEIDRAVELSKTKLQNAQLIRSKIIDSKLSEFEKNVKLGACCSFLNGYAFKSKEAVEESSVQLLRMGNLYANVLDLQRKPVFYPEEFEQQYSKYVINAGDVVMTLTGTVGKRDYGYATRIPKTDKVLLLNQRILKLFDFDANSVNQDYLLYVLRSDDFLEELYATANGTRQANLSSETIKSIEIPLPDLLTQQRLVSTFDRLASASETYKCANEEKIRALLSLKSALLAQELQSPQSDAA